jgi:anion-transporting  ArsA/GET3 family ATPase
MKNKVVNFGTMMNLELALANKDIEKAREIVALIREQQQKTWQELAPDEQERENAEGFLKKVFQTKDRCETVTEFITKYTMNNEDGFYTPNVEVYPNKKKAHDEFESRGWPDHAGKEKAHPRMTKWLELPYGQICKHCGGSMVAVIQLDEDDNVLETTLADCG